MPDKPTDLVQGTLDMLILKTLALEPMHGYGIAIRIEQMSKGVFHVNAGSLFIAIQRLVRAGLIRGEWNESLFGWPYSAAPRARNKLRHWLSAETTRVGECSSAPGNSRAYPKGVHSTNSSGRS